MIHMQCLVCPFWATVGTWSCNVTHGEEEFLQFYKNYKHSYESYIGYFWMSRESVFPVVENKVEYLHLSLSHVFCFL